MVADRMVPCSSVSSCGSDQHGRAHRAGVRDAFVDVGDGQCDVEHAVAVAAVVIGQRAVRVDRALDHEPHRARGEHERVMIAVAGGRTGVGDQLHPERGLEVVRGLGGVTHRPHHRVPATDRKRVSTRVVLHQAHQLAQLLGIQVGQTLRVVQRCVEDSVLGGSSGLDRHFAITFRGAGCDWGKSCRRRLMQVSPAKCAASINAYLGGRGDHVLPSCRRSFYTI